MIQNRILDWYDKHQRILPWRSTPTPYRVWISEIMLQQTRVETVIPYFERFMKAIPNIRHLSEVDDDVLNKLWEGLGYYSRARNLKKAAIQVMNEFGGYLPKTEKELLSLSGIGPYTSGAILSIAFNEPYTAVDGNVLRVFSRYYGIRENIKSEKIKKEIKVKVEKLLPNRVGDFNQALMEIGATVCLPNGKPKCLECPLSLECIAFNENLTDEIPVIERLKKRTSEEIFVFVYKCKDKYAIEKRPPKGLLAGLYQFPNTNEKITFEELNEKYKNVERLAVYKHVFTHKEWEVTPFLIEVIEMDPKYIWATKQELKDKYSIPSAFNKIQF